MSSVLCPIAPLLGVSSWPLSAVVVVSINGLLSIGLLWLAGQLWQLRRTLRSAAQGMESAARGTHATLGNAPQGIASGQRGIYGFRQSYRTLEPNLEANLQKITWILTVLRQLTQFWTRGDRRSS
ncbi:MAG TPA: hypothetical protein V6D46_00680 [Coleofasciculaceae cyanobacterium]